MKINIRNSAKKYKRMCGFRKWSKTAKGRKMMNKRRGKMKRLTTA
jgi:ribosomal protein L34